MSVEADSPRADQEGDISASGKRQIARATGIMGVATLLSRITGLVRDMIIGRVFGAGMVSDAFFMAFTIPNLLRRFFAEGSLTAAFVPTFAEVLRRDGPQEAARVQRICLTLLIVTMTMVTAVGVLASPYVVQLIGYGFGSVPGKLELTDLLNRWMFPYIFLVSVLALLTGVLNVYGHFFLPALSPVFLNLALIGSALWLAPRLGLPVMALAYGVLGGGLCQLLVLLPALRRHRISLRWDWAFRHPAVRQMTRLMVPGVAGVAIYQINVIVTRLLASFLPEGSVSYLYYGQRLFEFPQGVFIVALAQAALPTISLQAAAADHDGVRDSLRFALGLMLVGTLPAALGLGLCAYPVYATFFLGGAFSAEDVRQAARTLVAYAPGLVLVGVSRIIVPVYYALKDTRTPVVVSFWTLLANAGLGLLLMGPFGHVGLALALTLSAAFNALLLTLLLRRRLGPLGLRQIAANLGRMLLPLLLMGGTVAWILALQDWLAAGAVARKSAVLALAVAAGALVYAGAGLLCGVGELRTLFERLGRRRGARA